MASTASVGRQNGLLAALPAEDFRRLAPFLQCVDLEAGQVLSEQSSRQEYVHFPVTAVLSMQYTLDDGFSSEIATIGREGLVGASLFMDDAAAASQAIVQSGGLSCRGAAVSVLAEFRRGAAFHQLVLRHMQGLFMQLAQTSICNRRHSVEQRLCRWLLQVMERGNAQDLAATHDQLAGVLGVRRESVTAAAGRLQQQGAIQYRRGRISILEARALEQRACGCHATLKHLYECGPGAPGETAPRVAVPFRPVRPVRPLVASV
jgi:CRP-like cAMP-binding protein